MSPLLTDEVPVKLQSQAPVPRRDNLPIVATPDAPSLFGWPTTNSNGYTIRETPMGTKRPIRIVLLGAGASGINFLKQAADRLENVEVVCFEKNLDVGGTWLENK